MENASKALIIAGAILLSILIIAIGMYVYSSAQSTINSSLTQMSSSEKGAFNSTFTGYQGNQTGSQVKALIGDLLTNASTYAEEPAKIVQFTIDKGKISSKATTTSADGIIKRPEKENTTEDYCTGLNEIRNKIENKHPYWVDVNVGPSGVVEDIIVYYDNPNSTTTGGSTT